MTTTRDPHSSKAPILVDTHCHLDDQVFAPDLAEILDRAQSLGVTRWINVGYEPERWETTIALAESTPGMNHMLGLHPGYADLWSPEISVELRRHVEASNPVAIGEIGLDFFRGETNHATQIEAFTAQLDLARELGIPAVIHMRDSEALLLEVLQAQSALPTLLFHSFDGTRPLVDWIIEHCAYVGVGGLATRKKSLPIRQLLAQIPLDQIVLETDSPYLVPNGFKHRRNTPESIPVIAGSLAEYLNETTTEIARRTTNNAERLFERLSPS